MNYFDLLWKPVNSSLPIKHFSLPHIFSLLCILLIILTMYSYRRTLMIEKYKRLLSKIIGITLIIHQISLYFWYASNGKLTLKEALPLYLCRISLILSIIMMFNNSRKIFDILYFWGLGGASIALIFHDTSLYPFPHYIFIQFFISHGGILISVFFMMFIYGYSPNINSLIRTSIWTLIYFMFIIPINYIVDGNYCYLRYKPCFTPLDYLPDEPIYFVPFIILGFYLLFYLMFIPFRHKLSV
ncbi:TIGR02206 family membrane protein [Clostridium bovifaecis]|uniref:TIGR02206 family membrane protein n=1 Tax=Clostridium bovifaecis TaxID=2184719 RepID=A0A6I6EXR1_9CLOT|nr:TIGR02206 family membrane protein [Clostridium bovifaecis]